MVSMLKPGEAAKMGGRSITGVSGPSGWVRSTTWMLPWRNSSTSRESTVTRDGIGSGSLGLLYILTNPAFKQERILRQLEVHAVVVGAGGVDAGDNHAERLAFKRIGGGFHKV